MRGSEILAAAMLLSLCGSVAFPQSLADIARKEEERRKTIKTSSKVYTNGDLGGGADASPQPAAPVTPPSAATTAPGSRPTTPEAGKAQGEANKSQGETKDQAYWKDRISQARAQLERTKTLLDGMQSRINALSTDVVNVDDPARRAVIERDRQKALAEMERLKRETQEQTKAIADIEEEARRANVPPGWLR